MTSDRVRQNFGNFSNANENIFSGRSYPVRSFFVKKKVPMSRLYGGRKESVFVHNAAKATCSRSLFSTKNRAVCENSGLLNFHNAAIISL